MQGSNTQLLQKQGCNVVESKDPQNQRPLDIAAVPWAGACACICIAIDTRQCRDQSCYPAYIIAPYLTSDCNVLRGKHRCVRGGLVGILLYLHAACHANKSLTSREISNMDESIVERCEDVSYAKDVLALTGIGHVWC